MPASMVLYDAASLNGGDTDDGWDGDMMRSFKTTCASVTSNNNNNNNNNQEYHQHVRRHVRPSDRRLAEMADRVTRSINWNVLRSSAALWDKKRAPSRSHSSADFALYTRKSREMHYIMASGGVACSLVEMRNILRATTDEKYAATMTELYGNRYIYGSVVHRTSSNATSTGTTRALTSSSIDSNSRSSNNQSSALSPDAYDLLVKTATFVKPHVFARNEQWCYLEHFQPQTDAQGFVLAMHSLDPDDVFVGKTKANVNQLQEMTAAYSVVVDSKRRGVRVVFYAQIAAQGRGGEGAGAGTRVASQVKHAASKNTLTSRLMEMAKATSRLPMIVRRRRLGAQVYADRKTIMPTNTRCICCTKGLHVLKKKKKCHLCGYFVCEKCSIKQHMQRSRIKNYQVRICEHCIERVDEANYDHIPSEGMSPPAIQPNDPNASPAGTMMTELLRKSLESAPAQKKQAVMKVIKYLVDDDVSTSDSLASSVADSPIRLTDQTLESQYIKALETQLRIKETSIDQIKLANATSRKYPIKYAANNEGVPKYPVPKNEQHRLGLIKQRRLTEMKHVPELEIICALVSKELNCSGGLVTIMDKDTMHVLAATEGFTPTSLPREQVFCAHTVMSGQPLMIPHPETDINYCRMEVVAEGGLRFYFGFPLKAEDDTVIGTVCCFGVEPREVSQAQFATVERLANTASKLLQARMSEGVRSA